MTYTIVRSRRKTLAIHIKPDGSVEARAPLRFPKREIERFVASKERWIEASQKKAAARAFDKPHELPPPLYSPSEFERAARELAKTWERRLGVSIDYIGFRAMSSRWGSSTPKTRRIRINTALMYCPLGCLEYIIVHELAHLLEGNHSPRFWAIVADALPDYKARQRTIRAMSWLLSIILA